MKAVNQSNSVLWDAWQQDCQALGIALSEAQRGAFERLYALLLEANQTTNLTRITAEEDFLNRHLLDSLAIVPLLPQDAKLVDIGSGAGFPAIPVAIARPDVQVVAVESVGKKCQFIELAQKELALPNLSVCHERSEVLGQQPAFREQFDVVTARAVAALPVLLELCMPLVKVGGQFMAMKGLSYEAELTASKHALKILGGRLKEVQSFEQPQLTGSRVLIFEKLTRTPKIYPRQAGTPTKKPL